MRKAALAIAGFSILFAAPFAARAQSFIHPGLLHGREDLDRMRAMVAAGREPWKSAWNRLLAAPVAKLNYATHEVENLSVASGGAAGTGQQDDAGAAHFHAIQWAVTGNAAHAQKAMAILNAWSYKLKTMGGTNARLQCGITGFKFCNAAEILRHTWNGWPPADVERFRKMMLEIYYPVIQNWAPTYNGNWDAYMIATMMSIGIFSDNRAIFDRAVNHLLNGQSNGSIRGYIWPSGQCQESTRDQMHVQMGLGAMACAMETGYRQGLDLYGAFDNRFLLGLEYTARYNLGHSVPSEGTISSSGRGIFRPMWEISYRHFAVRKGLATPYVKQVVERIRPEGYEQDYVSLGTLLFYADNSVSLRPVSTPSLPSARAVLFFDANGRLRTGYPRPGAEARLPDPGSGSRHR